MSSPYFPRVMRYGNGGYGHNPADFQLASVIGQCCDDVGLVYLAFHHPTRATIIYKKFNIDKAKDELENIQNEIILSRELRHPNVAEIDEAFVLDNFICVTSELMEYGSCRDLIQRYFPEGLPELAIAYIMKDILKALDYIHKKGYIHRAVRASHILVGESGEAVLGGLRYACRMVENGKWQRNVHSFPPSTSRNLNWLSPEVLEQNLQGYNEKSDIYSLGVTACELANGMTPFQDHSPTLMLTEKVRGFAPVVLDRTTCPQYSNNEDQNSNQNLPHDPEVGDNVGQNGKNVVGGSFATRRFSDHFHRFTELCLQRDPEHRPSAGQLLVHSFIKSTRRLTATPRLELLRPAISITTQVSDAHLASGGNPDLIKVVECINDMDLNTCEWDF